MEVACYLKVEAGNPTKIVVSFYRIDTLANDTNVRTHLKRLTNKMYTNIIFVSHAFQNSFKYPFKVSFFLCIY